MPSAGPIWHNDQLYSPRQAPLTGRWRVPAQPHIRTHRLSERTT